MKFERPPTVWIAWLALVVGAILFSALCSGCATTSAYNGPVATQVIVSLNEKRHFVQEDPRWPPVMKVQKVLSITNPDVTATTVAIECEGSRLPPTNVMATPTSMRMVIPGRTTQYLLLLPEDGACEIKQWK